MPVPAKHVPQRTCVACGRKMAKRELVRVVRTPEGKTEVDQSGKKIGRGAYLCRRIECWQEALKHPGRLEHVLKGSLQEEGKETLLSHARALAGEKHDSVGLTPGPKGRLG